ncbi:MAG TPA: carotenoid oxygenase family protein [Oculatellaceae cyanobacterium]
MLIKKAWARALAQPAQEFPPTHLPILSGQIPEGLRGTLYRNGPGRLERGGVPVGHWFDGDGGILGVHFTEAGATGVYRYVQTAGYQTEAAAGRFLYSNYGMTAPGAIWQRWGKPVKNVANTSVLALSDKLLALWEGGKPHALDLQTLETWGMDDLGGLENRLTYSAHYKCDPHTGEIFNFGITTGIKPALTLNLYRSDATGKILQKAQFQLDGFPLIHDFVLAGQYLVCFVPPVRLTNLLSVLFGLSSYSDALEWQPNLGTQVLVFDRNTLSLVSRSETDPWFQWHIANGYVDEGGMAIAHLVRYDDFQTNQYLKEVATGATHTKQKGTLWRICFDPQTAKVTAMEELLDRGCEFPTVPKPQVGQASPYIYLALHREGVDTSQEMFGAIARFDTHTHTVTEADLGENRYPSEPLCVQDAHNPQQSWVLTLVWDGNSDTSEVWVFDSDGLDREPVCRLKLPSVVPLGFHGTWKPNY